jgi:hypothetical protein
MLNATLKDGSKIGYLDEMLGEGASKEVHLSRDKKSVICFFKGQADGERLRRLEAILDRFNPTNDPENGKYFKTLFCWPTAIVTEPRLGVMCPIYPDRFLFQSGPWSGEQKNVKWFTAKTPNGNFLRDLIPAEERGSWDHLLRISAKVAEALGRLHELGVAFPQLDGSLIDPTTGSVLLTDLEALILPGFQPDFLPAYDFMAPEEVSRANRGGRARSMQAHQLADRHHLAVFVHLLLLGQHPLVGPKVHSRTAAEEDDRLSHGPAALYIWHPSDHSNRPAKSKVTLDLAGPYLKALFLRAFVDGLHSPKQRPSAHEWRDALLRTLGILHPCANPACPHRWFVRYTDEDQCLACSKRSSGSRSRSAPPVDLPPPPAQIVIIP